MKILMVQGGFGAGGAEKIMAMLAAHRRQSGDEVHVAGMFMPETGSYFEYPADIPLHVLAPGAAADKLLQLRRLNALRRLIRAHRPDLIISFLTKVNCLSLLAAMGTGIPVIISERNNPKIQSARFWGRLQHLLAPRAAGIVMQTEGARADLPPREGRRSRVIPNPCQPVAFQRHQPGPVCQFIAVGRLDPQKGFDLLIDAFAALPDPLAARLTIFGDGLARDALAARIADHGMTAQISLAGVTQSPADWLGLGDAVVVSSRYEGFSNVVAEASCSGLPVISFDCPYGPGEMIRHDRNGLIVPPLDVAGLTAAMQRFIGDRDLRGRLGQSPDLTRQMLDPERVMSLWDCLIADACRVGQAPMPASASSS